MLKAAIQDLLLSNNIYISRTTPYSNLVTFLSSLKPTKTNYELIRVGGEGDGGYLIPDDLEGIDTCFSPGVAKKTKFENDMTKRGVKCFLADFSVDLQPINNPLFDFEKKYLGTKNDETFITLENWINLKAPNKTELILQMDIEGSEYPVILNTSDETLSKFRILVIEFHSLESINNIQGYELIRLTFLKLLKNFDIVHIHPNNCCGSVRYKDLDIPRAMEFSFLRKDRITHRSPAKKFPHPLDRKNVANKPEVHLQSCWF